MDREYIFMIYACKKFRKHRFAYLNIHTHTKMFDYVCAFCISKPTAQTQSMSHTIKKILTCTGLNEVLLVPKAWEE